MATERKQALIPLVSALENPSKTGSRRGDMSMSFE